MRIDDLDESQGLTREMVDHYLNRNGWCNMPDPDQRLLKPQYAHLSFKMGLGAAVERIAAIVGSTPQSILREINPRMRKGMPSEAAINACPFWLVRDSETHEIELHLARKGRLYALCDCAEKLGGRVVVDVLQGIVMEWERLSPLHLKDFGDVMQFWPCDKHGNKVRWPTDADGKML